MATWADFESAAPELATFGAGRLRQPVAYLGTVRPDGSARVHAISPIVGGGRLFVFMEPTSPKGHDLRRDPRYTLHSLVTDQNGTGGELLIRGRATPIDDAATRRVAAEAANYTPADRYVLFELSIEGVASTVYENGRPRRHRWGTP
ncbi:MAG: pyridoxamine 5'-phosphate oxidase family protein [Dehalococcoidia bacterium]